MTVGRTIPALPACPASRAEAIRAYRNSLGAAVTAAQGALGALTGPLATTTESLQTVKQAVDAILATNPDPATPSSTDELTDAIGGVQPTQDRETLERHAADLLDLNIVNGVLYPKGSTSLTALRALAAALGITAENCDLDAMGAALGGANGAGGGDGTGTGTNGAGRGGQGASAAAIAASASGTSQVLGAEEGFLLVSTRSVTVERVVGSTCGEDIVEFEVVEQPLGTNVNVNQAAEQAGVDPAAAGLRLFWLDEVRTDRGALDRLRGLGLTAEELGAAVTGQDAGRLTGQVVDTSVIGELRKRLSDEEICALLARSDTGGITVDPTADQLIATLTAALNQNTGGNRNRAGTDEEAITSGAAGRGGNPVLLLFSLVDFLRTFNLYLFGLTRSAWLDIAIIDDGTELVEKEEDVRVTGLTDEQEQVCDDITAIVNASLQAIQAVLSEAQAFMRNLYGSLGLGSNQISAGVEFTSCIASFNLGLDLNIDIAFQLPFLMEAFLVQFVALLTSVVAAVTALRLVICQPQGVVALLYGGICGFKPFDFGNCPPFIQDMVDRLLKVLNTIIALVGKITGACLTMKSDFQYATREAYRLKSYAPCALAALGIGVAFGLQHTGDLVEVSTPTTVNGQPVEVT